MVSSVLSKMIMKAMKSLISRFEVESGSISISHLQFADNTMIFCEVNMRKIGFLRCILCAFEAVTGLNINLAKSEVFSVGDVLDLDSLAWISGCKIGVPPSSYFGMPLGAPFKSKVIWNPVIERMESRLESWKASLLSKRGRLILIKAVMASIPNYLLSLFTIPVLGQSYHMERMIIGFLCNNDPKHHKYHLID